MQLGLSSAAAPDAPAADLLAACVRRGLSVLVLREGHAHDVHAWMPASHAHKLRAAAAAAGVDIGGFCATSCADVDGLAALSFALDAPIVVATSGAIDERIACAQQIRTRRGRALVAVSGAPSSWLPAIVRAGVEIAWTPDRTNTAVAADAETVLHSAFPLLRSIQLVGGGPETAMEDGRGIGALMAVLALAAYDGSIVLSPSDARYRVAWSAWLGRRGGWGCGSKADEGSVQLIARAGGVS